jgi:hypothetical protein
VSDNWAGWPPGWPVTERFLQLPQTCRLCERQLQGTWGRGTPVGWMHKECAITAAAAYVAAQERPVYVLPRLDEDEDPEV